MIRRGWIVLALLVSLGINVGVFVTLVGRRAAARRATAPVERLERFAGQLDRVADHLGLVGEERSDFIETQRRFVAAVRRHGRALEAERRRLRTELLATTPDRDRVANLVDSIGRTSMELDRAFADNVLLVRETLDGDGERRYLRFVAQIYNRGREGRQRGRR